MKSRKKIRSARLRHPEFKIELESHIAREVGAVIYLGLAIVFYLIVTGRAGVLGDFLNHYLRLIFGIGTFILPLLFLGFGITLFVSRQIRLNATRFLGIGLLLFSALGLIHMRTPLDSMLENVEIFGGYVGFLSSVLLRIFISDIGARVILISILIVGILITFEVSFSGIFSIFMPERKVEGGRRRLALNKNALQLGDNEELNIVKPLIGKAEDKQNSEPKKEEQKVEKDTATIHKPSSVKKTEPSAEIFDNNDVDYTGWELPPLDLLSSASSEVYVSDKVLKANAEKIREKLSQFNIDVTMRDVNIGPTVVQYTLQPHEGIKLNKITVLKNDLALALAAKSIRIEAPIPGKPLVGIEVPNEKRMVVHLREILESGEFLSLNSKLRLPVGRDVSGVPVIDDLASMPHLLIAGATGSGKSVGMNTFLLSLLYQNSPQELRFIMVDPKRVELTSYNGIPHLLTPVITDPFKAHAALKWAVAEMHRRYKELAEKRYRNIEEYNAAEPKPLYKIVIVIDELADLMMQASKKETEALICRIAQMARAVGMHLIVATQRPSVDVITGVIKANIPTRIAFTVTSGVDSRTIIDSVGAEDLLGMGDMLYLPGNMSRSIRVQGVYVSSKEIERVTNRVKLTSEPAYLQEITSSVNIDEEDSDGVRVGSSGDTNQDTLCEDALVIIKETGKASASLLQRRLSVGYARAARILDILEERGVIGPTNGAKPRKIYIK
ncbi:cell division protein FtsK [Candidatus Peregrinibacteria bacterium CG_4_10_14_0_2_um_filter_43_11]|nr:MAG: cell division protein FtsK [Candidatus Peregrinibacteria bacterium CG_4_10_14_0_2_um_filter_43_11]